MSLNTSASIVEARKLYTQQMTELLTPLLYQGIKSIFDSCKTNDKRVLKSFQEKLCFVSKWNQTIIDKEFSRILKGTDCNWMDKLLEAVFVSNVKVLSSVAFKTDKVINIKIPDTKNFIHKCYIECARYFYKIPSLIDDRREFLSFLEIQKNVKLSNMGISDSIEKTIRDSIPIQDILENYLNQNDSDSEDVYIEKEENGGTGSNVSDIEKRSDRINDSNDSNNSESEIEDVFMENPHPGNINDDNNIDLEESSKKSDEYYTLPKLTVKDDEPDLYVSKGGSIDEDNDIAFIKEDDEEEGEGCKELFTDHKPPASGDSPFFSDSD